MRANMVIVKEKNPVGFQSNFNKLKGTPYMEDP